MHTTVTKKQIYGKQVRTNNQNTDVILGLWEDFLRLELKGDVYAVYSNYTSDFTGDYDLHIGTEAIFTTESSVTIPAGDYYEIEVDSTVPNAVYNAWLEIWKSDIKRAYKTDFEFYAQDGRVKIFLSVE